MNRAGGSTRQPRAGCLSSSRRREYTYLHSRRCFAGMSHHRLAHRSKALEEYCAALIVSPPTSMGSPSNGSLGNRSRLRGLRPRRLLNWDRRLNAGPATLGLSPRVHLPRRVHRHHCRRYSEEGPVPTAVGASLPRECQIREEHWAEEAAMQPHSGYCFRIVMAAVAFVNFTTSRRRGKETRPSSAKKTRKRQRRLRRRGSSKKKNKEAEKQQEEEAVKRNEEEDEAGGAEKD